MPAGTALNLIGHQGIPFGEAAKNDVYCQYKIGAKKRGHIFKISKKKFIALVTANCSYCGREPANSTRRNRTTGNFLYNGIDRVDNNLGYTPNNCVTCCWECNRAKGSRSKNEFISHIKRSYEYLYKAENTTIIGGP